MMTDHASDVELYRPPEVLPLSAREVDTIKAVLAPGVSDDELALFVKVANHLGLSPFRDEVALIGRYSRQAGRNVYKHQVTVHGRRVLAARTHELRGIDGPYWTGPKDAKGEYTWVDVWDDDAPPHAARVFVYRHGWAKPVNGTAPWREFAQRDSKGELGPMWARMPAHMLGKVAESMALRRAFPEVITAAVAGEWDDVDQAEPPASPSAGGEGDAAREVGTTPSPGPRSPATTVPMMTPDQADTIGTYLGQLGLAGEDMRPARMRYLSDTLSRDVGDSRTITWEEGERLIAALVAAVAALYEREPPEPEPEGAELQPEGAELQPETWQPEGAPEGEP